MTAAASSHANRSAQASAPQASPAGAPEGVDRLEAVVNLCKRRGFVFPSAEIYGGFRSTYDYGPVGVLLLRNIKEAWWRSMVQMRPDVVGLDAAILSPPAIWEASGHLESFTDPLTECRSCGRRYRADQLEEIAGAGGGEGDGDGEALNPDGFDDANDNAVCPGCGARDSLGEPRQFNLMFRTHAGPVVDAGAEVYLRPETAQGMFVNFANVQRACRLRPPFGIAQIGKSFRNEITPGNFIFRTREFEQMEMEFFVPPADAPRWHEHWCAERLRWYRDLGIPDELLRLRPHDADELSHYSAATSDVEFRYPWGWGELEGIANRTDYDLRCHAEHSGERLEYFDAPTGERYVPHVIEPAAGATRAMMAFLLAAYDTEEVRGDTRVVLRLHRRLAPYQVAVLPLSKKEPLLALAGATAERLAPHWSVDFDVTQSIGRRYRRQDELGTPFCVTIDFETPDDDSVTVRERDSMRQNRLPIGELVAYLRERLDY